MIGYARVSTREQSLDMQREILREAGCLNIHEEVSSGAKANRPALDRCIKELRPGDTLVVWRLDRLARSMQELYRRLDAINANGAAFKSLHEDFDFTTAVGKLLLGIFGLVAEFERQITVERTAKRMEQLKASGKKLGAKPKLTPAMKRQAEQMMRRKGKRKMTVAEIAAELGVSTNTIYTHFKGGRKKVEGRSC